MNFQASLKDKARFSIRLSTMPRAGRGVFARVAIRKGERMPVTGIRIRRGSWADHCTSFADPYKFRMGKDLLIPTGYGGLVNHSARPNLMRIVHRNRLFLEALRPIQTGEELFHRYSRDALRRFR